MIDFACKTFNIEDVIKCELNLTKADFKIFLHFVKNNEKEFDSQTLARQTNLQTTTAQKAVKKLHEKNIITRYQKNLPKGGYNFTYKSQQKYKIRKILKQIINEWTERVYQEIEKW